MSVLFTLSTAASVLASGFLNSLGWPEVEVRKRKMLHPECFPLLTESSNTGKKGGHHCNPECQKGSRPSEMLRRASLIAGK